LVNLLKDKRPSGIFNEQECLTVFLANENLEEAKRFVEEMRQKLRCAKLIFFTDLKMG